MTANQCFASGDVEGATQGMEGKGPMKQKEDRNIIDCPTEKVAWEELEVGEAVGMLLAGCRRQTAGEQKAAQRLAERLGRRAEFLRVAAGVLEDEGGACAGSCEGLERALECLLLDEKGRGTSGGRLVRMAAALWELARSAIMRRADGSSWTKFARVVALFGGDGIREEVLKDLCVGLGLSGVRKEKAFLEALEKLRKFGLTVEGEGRIAMPLVMREGVLGALGEDGRGALADEVGAALAQCEVMLPEDWVPLAGVTRAIRHFPHEGLAGTGRDGKIESACNIQVLFLRRNPKFAAQCDWGLLSGRDWVLLLEFRPEFAGQCPPDKLRNLEWGFLLKRQPGLAECCPWNDLTGTEWVKLLLANPIFADRPEWTGKRRERILRSGEVSESPHPQAWSDQKELVDDNHEVGSKASHPAREKTAGNKLTGEEWAWLLTERPEFGEWCPWRKLNGKAWANLLSAKPEFAERCPWRKLNGEAWANLLSDRPEFAGKCPWKKLTGEDWADLLTKQPQFADCCAWEKLNGFNWCWLLRDQPQFASLCNWNKLDGGDWRRLLMAGVVQAGQIPWEKLDGRDWIELLTEHTEYAERCAWDVLDEYEWGDLLAKQPQFSSHCPDRLWGEMPRYLDLVLAQPQFLDHFKLTGLDWAYVLRKFPEFAIRCEWRKLSGQDWAFLLCAKPQFAERCPWGLLNGEAWVELLRERPEFGGVCDWKALSDEDWRELLRVRPGFATRKREVEGKDGMMDGEKEDAGVLLERFREGIAARMPKTKLFFHEGDIVGEWTVKGLLGRGGSAEVYAAIREGDGLAAVLKVQLPPEQAHHRGDTVARVRFSREAHFLEGHPGKSFPAFYGQGEVADRLWMALERLEDFPLPEGEAAVRRYLLEVGEAVAALHSMGWVHRDIKPKNILRRADGHAVLADFGLITQLEEERDEGTGRLSMVGGRAVGVGTPGFASPEQLSGGAATVRADVYALGILANECFHRAPPRAWQEIVLRAASGVQELRYATVEEMMAAIRALGEEA